MKSRILILFCILWVSGCVNTKITNKIYSQTKLLSLNWFEQLVLNQTQFEQLHRLHSPYNPKYRDSKGMVYIYEIDPDCKQKNDCPILWIEYFGDTATHAILNAVNINIFLNDELQIREIYNELNQYFTERYQNPPNGGYGEYTWILPKENSQIYLHLHKNSQSITVNWSYQK